MIFDRELRLKQAGQDDGMEAEEVPASEQALQSNSEVAEQATKARGDAAMSRDEAILAMKAAPVIDMPHRAAIEARFGMDLSFVRVHSSAAASAVRSMGAQAFTFGEDIAFADEAPDLEVVAHEVTHVLQQRGGAKKGVAADEAQADKAESAAGAAEVADELQETKPGGHGLEPEMRKKAVTHAEIPADELAKPAGEAGVLTDGAAASAIAWNDRKWQGAQRAQILAYLRGAEGEAAGAFTKADVERVAKLQAGAGCSEKECDGKIGDTTMAILLHAGLTLNFEGVKPKPSDVQLIFYPGEFEDIEAWKQCVKDAAAGHEGDPTFNVYRAMAGHTPQGTGRLYVKYKGNLVEKIDCRGGPAVSVRDGTHTADPSKAGTYTLGAG